MQSLSLVGTAYSPLIYDLNQNSSFEQFIDYLKIVHVNLKKNPSLPDKIVRALINLSKNLNLYSKNSYLGCYS